MNTVVQLNNQVLGDFIVELLRLRLNINLRFGCLDDITLKTTRAELRDRTGASRIEDATIERMFNTVMEAGFHVAGRPGGNTFIFTVKVKDLLTKFESADELDWWNSDHAKLLRPRKVKVAAD